MSSHIIQSQTNTISVESVTDRAPYPYGTTIYFYPIIPQRSELPRPQACICALQSWQRDAIVVIRTSGFEEKNTRWALLPSIIMSWGL